MNIGIVDSEINFKWRLFAKTISSSSDWGFDRLRVGGSTAWHLVFQVKRPDGSILDTQYFANSGFEHTFSFDLSENTSNQEYEVYIAGTESTRVFYQIYAEITGYSATYGRFSNLTYFDFNELLVAAAGPQIGRVRFHDNPISRLICPSSLIIEEFRIPNCNIGPEDLADALIALDNGGATGGVFDYSGNPNPPAERALTAYNNLKDNKSWTITGEVPSDAASPLLDTYANAKVGLSLVKERDAFTGSPIRVRRSSDNLEEWIGFDANKNLDETALLNHVGSGDGFIVGFYGQSLNAKDFIQTAAGSQPKIVSAGVIIRDGTLPAIEFDGVDDFLYSEDIPYWKFMHDGTKILSSIVASSTKTSRADIIGNIASSSTYGALITLNLNGNNSVRDYIGSGNTADGYLNLSGNDIYTLGNKFLYTNFGDATNTTTADRSIIRVNGGADIKNNTTTRAPSTEAPIVKMSLGSLNGGSTSNAFKGKLQHFIVWDDKSAVRTEIENEIKTKYEIA